MPEGVAQRRPSTLDARPDFWHLARAMEHVVGWTMYRRSSLFLADPLILIQCTIFLINRLGQRGNIILHWEYDMVRMEIDTATQKYHGGLAEATSN
jgi:hypothetical protein